MTRGSSVRRGEIWMLDFSPGRGSEQTGRRPALVIQNDFGNENPRYPNTIVLAMSTKGKPVPFHISITPTRENGLREVTYVKSEQILTVAKNRLLGKRALGRISDHQMRQVELAILLSLAIGR